MPMSDATRTWSPSLLCMFSKGLRCFLNFAGHADASGLAAFVRSRDRP